MNQELITFLKESYFIVVYGLTLIVAVITYRKYYDTVLRYFPILIAYTFFNELLGYFIRYYPEFSLFNDFIKTTHNDIIYNIYDLIYYGFFYFVYWKINSNIKYKKWMRILALGALASYIISVFFQDPFEMTLFYASATSSWILVFCILLYFYDKLLNKKRLIQPYNLMFWLSLGLLFFYTIFPFIFVTGFINYDIWMEYNLLTILRISIVIMYSIFIIGFIKGRRRSFT